MAYTLSSLAEALDLPLQVKVPAGSKLTEKQVADSTVSGVAPIELAKANEVSFLTNPKLAAALNTTKALAVIVHPDNADACGVSCLLSSKPYVSYAKLSQLFVRVSEQQAFIHERAEISVSAKIGKGASIAAGVVIGDGVTVGDNVTIQPNTVIASGAKLGDNVTLYSNVSLGHDVLIGDDVVIQSNTVVGGEGFGFAPDFDTETQQLHWEPIAQLGTVRIGDRVHVGANTTIDRGALSDTVIGDDVIIDNLVQVAHNVEIGQGTAIAGCVGIAGSAKIGRCCSIGGGAGIAGHLSIADNTTVLGMTLINKSIKQPGQYASGTGMQPAADWRKSAVRFTQLDRMAGKIKALEKEIKTIKSKTS